ncbi:MAG: glycosyltransferase family 2 protein [Planctomycetaceae bacterium]
MTVVIPALNEERVIAECLHALAAQTYPADRTEVVVVDNGSTDRTAQIAQELGAKVLHVAKRSAYVARNAAIAATSGEFLAFTDADCLADPRWIEELIAVESAHGTGIVAGHIEYRMSFDSLGNRMLIASRSGEVIRENVCVHHCAPTGNVLIRRDLLAEFGPFSEAPFSSDIAMSKKLAAHGHPPIYAPGAVVVHQCDLTSREYLSRTYWNCRGTAVHAPQAASFAVLVRELARVPWRPGLRSVPAVRSAVAERPQSPFLRTWLYMWLARTAGYAGRVAGTAARMRQQRPRQPSVGAGSSPSPPQMALNSDRIPLGGEGRGEGSRQTSRRCTRSSVSSNRQLSTRRLSGRTLSLSL